MRLSPGAPESKRGQIYTSACGRESYRRPPPDTSGEQAAQVAERVCRAVNQAAANDDPRPGITVGVAGVPPEGETGSLLLEAADRALYRAKAAGRAGYAVECLGADV